MTESYKMQSTTSPTLAKEMDEGITKARSSTDSLNSDDMLTMPLKPDNGKMTWAERWEDSKGMALVLVSETFGTGMAATARLLEMGDGGMTTLQIIFVRFSITFVLSSLYMYFTSVPDFPLGKKGVRGLLVLRGLGGFVGVFGFYSCLAYLPISEAILLSFLIPLFTAYACSLFLHQPFDKRQLTAGLISFLGVIIIARPDKLWFDSPSSISENDAESTIPAVTPVQHLYAVLLALFSDIGATVAFTSIRVIGDRAHPLLSVNYYGLISTLISGSILFFPFLPRVEFRLPRDGHEWILLLGLGVFGFGLQFLMTAGLVKDKSPRATNMMYSSVVFSLAMDWAIWGLIPGWSSWVGRGIVMGATIWAALSKTNVDGARVKDEEYLAVATEDDRD